MYGETSLQEETADVVAAIETLKNYNIPAIVVSMGGAGSLAKYEDTFYRVSAPPISAKNTVGCGDCLLAGLLHGFSAGFDIEAILRYASAASAAAAECELSVGFSASRAKELFDKVEIKKI